jgi:hypothetical protein
MRPLVILLRRVGLLLLPVAMIFAAVTVAAHAQGPATFRLTSLASPGFSNFLYGTSTSSTTDTWAVGYYSNSTNTELLSLTEHWNGQSWQLVSSPSPADSYNILNGVADLSPTNAWAVGYTESSNGNDGALIEHWNGTSWSVVPPATDTNGLEDGLSAISAISASNIWAVGSHFDASIGGTDGLVEHWNGSTWTIIPSSTPPYPLDSVVTISSTNVWAGIGSLSGLGPVGTTTFEHWNGQSWSVVSGPSLGSAYGSITSLTAVSATDIWAAGSSRGTARRSPTEPLFEHWNGTAWSIVPGATLSSYGPATGITALSGTDAWATVYPVNGAAVVEHWDGSQWNTVSVPVPAGSQVNQLDAISSLPGGTVVVVGRSDSSALALVSTNG